MKYSNSSSNINAIKEVRRLFDELRSNLSSIYKKEAASMFFKEKEQDGQKNVIKNIARYIKNISRHLKNCGKHLNKI